MLTLLFLYCIKTRNTGEHKKFTKWNWASRHLRASVTPKVFQWLKAILNFIFFSAQFCALNCLPVSFTKVFIKARTSWLAFPLFLSSRCLGISSDKKGRKRSSCYQEESNQECPLSVTVINNASLYTWRVLGRSQAFSPHPQSSLSEVSGSARMTKT